MEDQQDRTVAVGHPIQQQPATVIGYPVFAHPHHIHPPTDTGNASVSSSPSSYATIGSFHISCLDIIFQIGTALIMGGLCISVILLMSASGFEPPEIKVESATVDAFNISTSDYNITTNWSMEFSVRNPNSGKLYYDNLEVSVKLQDFPICSTRIEGNFSQDPNEKKVIQTGMNALSMNVNQTVGKIIVSQREKGGLNFTIKLDSGLVRDTDGFRWKKRKHLIVICDLEVGFSSPSEAGNLMFAPVQCNVHI